MGFGVCGCRRVLGSCRNFAHGLGKFMGPDGGVGSGLRGAVGREPAEFGAQAGRCDILDFLIQESAE